MFWETEGEKNFFMIGFGKQLARLDDYLECELGIDTENPDEPKNEEHKHLMYYLSQMRLAQEYLDKGTALIKTQNDEKMHGLEIGKFNIKRILNFQEG